jgi:hypothetical protein
LHLAILTRRQSKTYKAMLGAPFDPARSLATAGEGADRGKAGPDGGTSGVERPASARDSQATAPSPRGDAAQPQGKITASPLRGSLRERRGHDSSVDRP